MNQSHLDKANEYLNMPGQCTPTNPPPGEYYGAIRLLQMTLQEIIEHLRSI